MEKDQAGVALRANEDRVTASLARTDHVAAGQMVNAVKVLGQTVIVEGVRSVICHSVTAMQPSNG